MRRTDSGRRPESLDGARSRFAKLLRARTSETERALAALRAELSSVGGSNKSAARRTVSCAVCGKSRHTKRRGGEQGAEQVGR